MGTSPESYSMDLAELLLSYDFQLESPLSEDQLSQSTNTTNTIFQKPSKKIRKDKVLNQSRISSPAKTEKASNREFWKAEEDSQLLELYETYGSKWSKIAEIMKTRTRKQIRDRYLNSLRPDINYQEWTEEEEKLYVTLREKYGNKWSKIAALMPGRTESQVKNKFYWPGKEGVPKKMRRVLNTKENKNKNENKKNVEKVLPVVYTHDADSFLLFSNEDEFYIPMAFKDSFEDIKFKNN